MSLPYPKEQQIHSLSLLANAAFDLQEPDFNTLQGLTTSIIVNTLANSDVQKTIGTDWQLLWGPVVYSHNPNALSVVADNTMMLLYSPSQNLFVVGIAGTNVVSVYGWMQEDFQVNSLVNWGSIIKKLIIELPQPAIATGTSNGLNILLGMEYNGQTMIDFLSSYLQTNNIPAGAEVAVAGHSLGGALAPVTAMYLQDMQGTWDKAGIVKTVSAWPTAGPTPGNAAFANYVAKHLSSYTSRYNPLDVVPHAWQRDTMPVIPTIYKDDLTPPESAAPYETFLGTLVAAAFLKTVNKEDYLPIDYTQIEPWSPLSGSEFNKLVNDKTALKVDVAGKFEPAGLKPYVPYLRNLACALAQMAYQHTTAYSTLLGIAEFGEDFKEVKANLTGKTEEERQDAAFHIALEKYYGIKLPLAKLIEEIL